MKNIIVIATACRTSGALTIYKQFLHHLVTNIADDSCYYIFIHPGMPKIEITGVHFFEYDTTRYIDRILFDWKKCRDILKHEGIKPDVVVSMQNIGLKCLSNCKTLIYYHQSLPFYPNKWNPFKTEERTLFYYKYIYPVFVRASLNDRTEVIVQIPFIKSGFVKKFNFFCDKVHVLFPDIERVDIHNIPSFDFGDNKYHFLYPATAFSYKNHKTIIEALKILKETNESLLSKIVVHFTLDRDNCSSMAETIREYNLEGIISFDGSIPHDKLLSMYKASTALLFPSEVETLGLPLVEAAQFGISIIASDLAYAREVLEQYKGQIYINPHDYLGWANAITTVCERRDCPTPLVQEKGSSWSKFFEILNR